MSILNTAILQATPPAAVNASVADSGAAWTFGSWVQFLASASGNVSIAGVSIGAMVAGSYSNQGIEIQIGTGAPGSESAIGLIKIFGSNSGSGSIPDIFMLPVPLGGIVNGDKVSVSLRDGAVGGKTYAISLLYYSNISSDQITPLTTPWTAAPLASDGVALTPNASGWVNSSWVVLSSALPTTAAIIGVCYFAHAAAADFEIDLGTGATGSETVITTLRGGNNGPPSRLTYSVLPVPYFLDAGTKVSVRMRKTGTDVNNVNFNLLYISAVDSGVPNVGGPPVARGKPIVGVPVTLLAGVIYGLPATIVNIEFVAGAASNLDVSVDGTTFFTAASTGAAGMSVATEISACYVRPTVDVTVILRKKSRR